MAKAKSSGGSVVHRVSDAGDHEFGIKHEGVFVPFGTVSAGRFGQLLERAHTLEEADEDQAAEEASD